MSKRFTSWGLNNRTRHPVLSINKSEDSSWELADIPMLAGSSGLDGPVLVRGISEERGSDYPTVFGRLVSPGYFPRGDFFPPLKTAVSDGKWVFCKTLPAAWPNLHKPKVTPAERV